MIVIQDVKVRVMRNARVFVQEHVKVNVRIIVIMDVPVVKQPAQQHVIIYAKGRVVPMNAKLHVHQIVEPHVIQIAKTIVVGDAKILVVLIIVLVDVIHHV